MIAAMLSFLRAAGLVFFMLAALPLATMLPTAAQEQRTAQERILREIEARGFRSVTGLARRGENYVFQALDPFGDRVRVVMDAETGEIVGFSRIMPKKK